MSGSEPGLPRKARDLWRPRVSTRQLISQLALILSCRDDCGALTTERKFDGAISEVNFDHRPIQGTIDACQSILPDHWYGRLPSTKRLHAAPFLFSRLAHHEPWLSESLRSARSPRPDMNPKRSRSLRAEDREIHSVIHCRWKVSRPGEILPLLSVLLDAPSPLSRGSCRSRHSQKAFL
jgi:hypothetical protein